MKLQGEFLYNKNSHQNQRCFQAGTAATTQGSKIYFSFDADFQGTQEF